MHTIEGVMKMKYEWKIILIGFVCSLAFMLVFTYGCSFGQKTLYAYQVGIYKEEDNKNQKLDELKDMGIEGYTYMKNNQYYVLSMISEHKDEIEKHATQVKGIMKTYIVPSSTTTQILLDSLSKGDVI